MAEITYADTWTPDFGVPYPFRYHYPRPEEFDGFTDEEVYKWAHIIPQTEQKAKEDPLKWGWKLPSWDECLSYWGDYPVIVILGGQRSSKSSMCSRLVLNMAETVPEARIRCWSVNDASSQTDQQKMIWEAMPQRLKDLRNERGKLNYSLQYSQKNGFSNRKVILPPVIEGQKGAEIMFQTYKGYANDPQISEGWWAHCVWGDEEMPQPLFETLLYRLTDARGRMLLSFTTLQGWTPLISDILGRTRTLKKRYSDLCKRELPVIQESLSRPGTLIYYFWTQDNPFLDTDTFLKTLMARPESEKLARGHGIPTKASGSKFPLFDENIHVVKHEDLPWNKHRIKSDEQDLRAYPVTFYHGLDPAGRKNWFMLWIGIDSGDTVWVVNEYPDESMGAWAEPGHPTKGKKGPAQEGDGMDTAGYVEFIQELENDEGMTIFERYIDPRMGVAERAGSSIASELEDEGMSFLPAPIFGVNNEIEHGCQLINDRLRWNKDEPLSATNSPRLFISDRCQNLIFAMKNYTGEGGTTEACKDPIDVLRYMLMSEINFVTDSSFEITGTGGY